MEIKAEMKEYNSISSKKEGQFGATGRRRGRKESKEREFIKEGGREGGA